MEHWCYASMIDGKEMGMWGVGVGVSGKNGC